MHMVYKPYRNNKLWINLDSETLSKLKYYQNEFKMSRNKLINVLIKTSLNNFPDIHSLELEYDENIGLFRFNNKKEVKVK